LAERPDSIDVRVVGDSGHFSAGGKGSTFVVSTGGLPGFMLDCGASPFSTLGAEVLGGLKGLIATHSHEDHKRWFSEILLYFRYDVQPRRKLRLLTTETIHSEMRVTSQAALERTLSDDLLRVIGVPYEEFVEQVVIGPRAKYRIERVCPGGAGGAGGAGGGGGGGGAEGEVLRVVDSSGAEVPPGKAKVVVCPSGCRERMLFFDEDYDEWVEPESFYDFGAEAFYEAEQNPAVDPGSGLIIRPVKAATWHGPPTVSIVFEAPGGDTRVAFSSDVRFDPPLWQRLAEERRDLDLEMGAAEFDGSPVIVGDINRLIQRTWSHEHYKAAASSFDGCGVFHDSDAIHSVVHTPYDRLEEYADGADGSWRSLILAYTPDYFVGRWPMTVTSRNFRITGGEAVEVLADGHTAGLAGEVYAKSGDRFYVGKLDDEGEYRLVRSKRGFDLIPRLPVPPGMGSAPKLDESACEEVGRVRLYRDIGGKYVPARPAENEHYRLRDDGRIEMLSETGDGSTGTIVEDERPSVGK